MNIRLIYLGWIILSLLLPKEKIFTATSEGFLLDDPDFKRLSPKDPRSVERASQYYLDQLNERKRKIPVSRSKKSLASKDVLSLETVAMPAKLDDSSKEQLKKIRLAASLIYVHDGMGPIIALRKKIFNLAQEKNINIQDYLPGYNPKQFSVKKPENGIMVDKDLMSMLKLMESLVQGKQRLFEGFFGSQTVFDKMKIKNPSSRVKFDFSSNLYVDPFGKLYLKPTSSANDFLDTEQMTWAPGNAVFLQNKHIYRLFDIEDGKYPDGEANIDLLVAQLNLKSEDGEKDKTEIELLAQKDVKTYEKFVRLEAKKSSSTSAGPIRTGQRASASVIPTTTLPPDPIAHAEIKQSPSDISPPKASEDRQVLIESPPPVAAHVEKSVEQDEVPSPESAVPSPTSASSTVPRETKSLAQRGRSSSFSDMRSFKRAGSSLEDTVGMAAGILSNRAGVLKPLGCDENEQEFVEEFETIDSFLVTEKMLEQFNIFKQFVSRMAPSLPEDVLLEEFSLKDIDSLEFEEGEIVLATSKNGKLLELLLDENSPLSQMLKNGEKDYPWIFSPSSPTSSSGISPGRLRPPKIGSESDLKIKDLIGALNLSFPEGSEEQTQFKHLMTAFEDETTPPFEKNKIAQSLKELFFSKRPGREVSQASTGSPKSLASAGSSFTSGGGASRATIRELVDERRANSQGSSAGSSSIRSLSLGGSLTTSETDTAESDGELSDISLSSSMESAARVKERRVFKDLNFGVKNIEDVRKVLGDLKPLIIGTSPSDGDQEGFDRRIKELALTEGGDLKIDKKMGSKILELLDSKDREGKEPSQLQSLRELMVSDSTRHAADTSKEGISALALDSSGASDATLRRKGRALSDLSLSSSMESSPEVSDKRGFKRLNFRDKNPDDVREILKGLQPLIIGETASEAAKKGFHQRIEALNLLEEGKLQIDKGIGRKILELLESKDGEGKGLPQLQSLRELMVSDSARHATTDTTGRAISALEVDPSGAATVVGTRKQKVFKGLRISSRKVSKLKEALQKLQPLILGESAGEEEKKLFRKAIESLSLSEGKYLQIEKSIGDKILSVLRLEEKASPGDIDSFKELKELFLTKKPKDKSSRSGTASLVELDLDSIQPQDRKEGIERKLKSLNLEDSSVVEGGVDITAFLKELQIDESGKIKVSPQNREMLIKILRVGEKLKIPKERPEHFLIRELSLEWEKKNPKPSRKEVKPDLDDFAERLRRGDERKESKSPR